VRHEEAATVIIDGMHGLGDNVHQRAVVRHLLASHPATEFWLKTPWPCLYHDLVGDRLRLIDPSSSLRTQRKNSKREQARYVLPPRTYRKERIKVSYKAALVQITGSVLGAMIRTTLKCDIDDADFRLPVPAAWIAKADAVIGRAHKPVMVLRPLVERTEWRGCAARNPDPVAYAALYNSIRNHFFVVSLADLVPQVEELVTPLDADICLHKGELDAEAIAGLMSRAALTFCSPGFAVPLSQAVGTPVIAVFGGFECSRSFSYGHRFAPTLGVDPINPCQCFSHTHDCDKRIDLPAAHDQIEEFIADNVAERAAIVTGPAADRLERLAEAIYE
jgi:ADP-heptose:LPS heptosyltransferase